MKYDIKKQLRSFRYAYQGLRACVGKEQNLSFHLVVALLVVVAGVLLRLSRMEWIAVTLCIGGVIGAELMNTAIERLVDMVSPTQNPQAGRVKDIAAAAVLLIAIAAAVVGLLIFIPKIL